MSTPTTAIGIAAAVRSGDISAVDAVEKAGGKLTVTAPAREKNVAPKNNKSAPAAEAEDDAGTDKE